MKALEAIERALDYIEAHLSDELTVVAVCESGGLSEAYCQRLFHATVGEPIQGYVRRRRLSRSAGSLLETDWRILDIAIEAGFESQEAYSRAFKVQFGLPPGRFRKRGQRPQIGAFPRMTCSRMRNRSRLTLQRPRVTEHPGATFAGVDGTFASALSETATNRESIPALWLEFIRQHGDLVERASAGTYGVCWRDLVDSYPTSDRLRYLAGVEIDSDATGPVPVSRVVVPAGVYAVFEHHGRIEEIEDTILYGLVEWLPGSGFDFAEAFEIDFHPRGVARPTEYWLPVKEGA